MCRTVGPPAGRVMDERRVSPETPDGMLAASARAGDLDAFEELYHRYVRHVYDFELRAVHDAAAAVDLTQSTFLRAHGRIEQLRDPDRVREWLFGLAYRLAVGQLRRGPVPAPAALLPRAAGPLRGGDVATDLDDVEGADLVWRAAAALEPDLYAVLDVTARQGLDVSELAQDAGLSRGEVMAQLERAHEAFGRAVRDLLIARSGDWCPGLASLVQTGELSSDERDRVDEHLGSCPRCRPIAERLTTPATLSETPLHPLDPGLQRDGWDRLVEQLAKASPRATRAALRMPEPPKEDSAQLVASESAMEYFAFPVPGQAQPQPETGIMRHASVRRFHAQADRSRFRKSAGWIALAAVVAGLVVAAVIVNTQHPAPRTTGLTRPSTTASPTTASTSPPTTRAPSTTTRPTTKTTVAKTTTTRKTTTTTTTLVVFTPSVGSMSPGSGFPGATIVLQGQHFVTGDLVDFTGPTLPGGTERLTPSSLTPTTIEANVPSFAAFAGQHIAVAVQDAAGSESNSKIFLVTAYWSGTWTKTGAKVSLEPSTVGYGNVKQGQINLFQTDVESEQCQVDDSGTVYSAKSTGAPVVVMPKTSTCPGQEFTISS
jgi:RNA polymerase sigma factor (sigma-70 family)